MRKGTVMAASAAVLTWAAAAPVLADEDVTPTPPAPASASGSGVIAFEPEFFAENRPNTALDMVNRLPGFNIDNGDDVRGFAGSAGNVLIDGARPASKSDAASDLLSRTPATQVERIDLIRGGAPGVEMQGHPVVVNVILRGEASRTQTLTLTPFIFEGGPYMLSGRYEMSVTEDGRTWGFQLGHGVGIDDGTGPGVFTRRAADGTLLLSEPMETTFEGGGDYVRGNWSGPLAGGRVELTGRLADDFWEQGARFGEGATFRRSDYRDDNLNGELGLRYERPIGESMRFEGRLIQNFRDGESQSVAVGFGPSEQVFASDYSSGESIGRASLRWERSERLTLETGGELAYNFLDTTQSFTVGGVPVPLPSASVKVEEVRGELFGQAAWRPVESLNIEAGVRLEQSVISQSGDVTAEKDLFFAKPRLQVTWTPWEQNQFRFRFERELGQLDFDDFAASASLSNGQLFGGNVDLEPEQRWITEAVYERRFWDEGVVSITLRHDEIVDAIDRIPLPGGLSATGNIGDGTMDRLAIDLTLPLDRLGMSGGRLEIGTKWEETEVIDPTTGAPRRISGVEHERHRISLSQDIPGWGLNWGVAYIPPFERVTYHPDETIRMEITDYWQVYAEYKPLPDLSIRAELTGWHDFPYERTRYADRITRAVDVVDLRQVDPREFLQIRIRKTF